MAYNLSAGYGQQYSTSAPLGAGKVFHICTAGTPVYDYLSKTLVPDPDGVQRLFGHSSTASKVTYDAFAAAAAQTVEDRNDYIVVWPANTTYYLDAAIALNKKAVHMICPAGLGNDIGATNAARLQQITASTAVIAVSDAAVEIAGFYIKNINQTAAITLAATSYALNIHHNTFPLIWTSGAQTGAIVGTGDAGAWGSIERNWFVSQSGGACTCAAGVIQIQASATACRVKYNEITIGDTQIATVGISNAAVKGITAYNMLSESGGTGATSGGTITTAIAINAAGAAIGNRCAVATGHFSNGSGTTGVSYTDNTDGITNGATSGNLGAQLET